MKKQEAVELSRTIAKSLETARVLGQSCGAYFEYVDLVRVESLVASAIVKHYKDKV